MAYPSSLDTFPTLNDGDVAHGYHFNNIHTALTAIETALGTSPQGTYTDVAAALTAIAAAAAVQPIHPFLTMGA